MTKAYFLEVEKTVINTKMEEKQNGYFVVKLDTLE